jgi:inosine-uridine nucleoside N-ribohydrolase
MNRIIIALITTLLAGCGVSHGVVNAAGTPLGGATAAESRADAGERLGTLAHGRRPVVITTDCGSDMDDQWVIAHTALSPVMNLRGVVGCHVPNLPSPEAAAANAREVLAKMPIKLKPPCFAGSAKPLEDAHTPHPNAGVNFIVTEARKCSPKAPLLVFVLGSGTDVASAILTAPSIARNMEVIGMAFDSYDTGKDGWNVSNDVKSWEVLLAAHMPVVIGDGPTTLRDLLLSRDQSQSLFGSLGAPGKFLAGLHAAWLDANPKMCFEDTGSKDKWPIWDEVAVSYVLGLTTSKVLPRPVLNDDCTFSHPAGGANGQTITWITSIDGAATFKNFQQCLAVAGK